MLQGECPPEIGVEHAMGKDGVGNTSPYHPIRAITVILPKTVDYDPVEPRQILSQPRCQPRSVAVVPVRRPECVNEKWLVLHERLCGIIEANQLHLRPSSTRLGQCPDAHSGTSGGR